MNALLFVSCFNYISALYCSMRCVNVPLNQYDDDDDGGGGGGGDDDDDDDDDDELTSCER